MKEKILIKFIRQGEVESEEYTRKFEKYMRTHGYTDYEVIGYGENSFDFTRQFEQVKEMKLNKVVVFPELEMMFPPARILIMAAQALQMGIEVYDLRNDMKLHKLLNKKLRAGNLRPDQFIEVMQKVPKVACMTFESDEFAIEQDYINFSAHCVEHNVVMMNVRELKNEHDSCKAFVKHMKEEVPKYVLIRNAEQLIKHDLMCDYSIIDELANLNIEVIETEFNTSITQKYEKIKKESISMKYANTKKTAVLAIKAKEIPYDEIGEGVIYALKKNYVVLTGMSFAISDVNKIIDEIVKFANEERADIVVIPSFENLGLDAQLATTLANLLANDDIQLESIKEGVVKSQMNNTCNYHFVC